MDRKPPESVSFSGRNASEKNGFVESNRRQQHGKSQQHKSHIRKPEVHQAGERREDGVRIIDNWREQPTAVIWARPHEQDPVATVVSSGPAVLAPEMTKMSGAEPEIIDYGIGPSKNGDNWLDEFATAPVFEKPIPEQRRQSVEYQWADSDRESAVQPRSFFWNEPEVITKDPVDHEVLPNVLHENAQTTTPPPEKTAEPVTEKPLPEVPPLDQAVDPNSLSSNQAGPDSKVSKSKPDTEKVQQKNSFLGRRRAKAAVQSDSMESSTGFEQFNEATAFADEPVPSLEAIDFPATMAALPGEIARPKELEQPIIAPHLESKEIKHAAVFAEQKNETKERAPVSVPVEQSMDQSELLEVAKSIMTDGVSVYEMFTASRIDEAGLRRIVVAYLRGDKLKQLISQEVIRQQMKFERDPRLRDTPVKVKGAGTARRTAARIKHRTKTLLDMERAKDKTEQLAEFTQIQLEKAQTYLHEGSNSTRTISIAVIVVIYATILILVLK